MKSTDIQSKVLRTDWIKCVANTPDTDLRAHRVALTYHFFARSLDHAVNGDEAVWQRIGKRLSVTSSNANWFNFGTWATVTINRDLRLGQAPVVPPRLLPTGVRRRLTPTILHLRAADGQRISRALSWGQRLVFLSTTFIYLNRLGPRVGLTELVGQGKDDIFAQIIELARWDEKTALAPDRHLNVVWDAFDDVYKTAAKLRDAAGTKHLDGATRTRITRLILRANLMITAVEQDVVNEAVGDVVDHVPQLVSAAATARAAVWGERLLGVPRELTGLQLPFRTIDARELFESVWARIMTDYLLVLALPNETLRLGRDIPPLRASQPFFPPQLSDLTKEPIVSRDGQSAASAENDELLRLVDAFDRSRGNGRGSAANDWRRYDERMNWAVNLLRSRQQEVSLFWSPYSTEDQRRIVKGRLPQRTGDPTEYEVQAPVEGLPSSRD